MFRHLSFILLSTNHPLEYTYLGFSDECFTILFLQKPFPLLFCAFSHFINSLYFYLFACLVQVHMERRFTISTQITQVPLLFVFKEDPSDFRGPWVTLEMGSSKMAFLSGLLNLGWWQQKLPFSPVNPILTSRKSRELRAKGRCYWLGVAPVFLSSLSLSPQKNVYLQLHIFSDLGYC